MAVPPAAGSDTKDLITGLLFTPIGLALLCAAVITGLSTHRFVQTAARAAGVVTRLNAGGSHPQVEFTAAGGTVVSYPQGGMIFGYRPGEKVTVLYDPRQPSLAPCISDTGALWDAAGSCLFLGSIFFGAGLMLLAGCRAARVRKRRT